MNRNPRRRAAVPRRVGARSAPTRPGPMPFDEAVQHLERALALREALPDAGPGGAVRLVHGAGDGLDGFVLEQFDRTLILQLHEGRLALDGPSIERLAQFAMSRRRAAAVYRKVFPRDRSFADADGELRAAQPWLGSAAAEEFPIVENGLRLLVRPYDGYATGLFLEQRDNRARVRARASGRRVLNAFAYTCAFGVAAAAGGAAEVVNVDVAKKALEWGRRNYDSSGLNTENQWFIADDVFRYYRRAQRQERRFGLIILDPPTFARSKQHGSTFQIETDLERLVAGALERLDAGGWLLLATNDRRLSLRRLEHGVMSAAREQGGQVEITDRPAAPADFPGDPEYSKSLWCRWSPAARRRAD